ncbi:MAG TPA: hypothetical protein PL078_01190 [Bacillota bacterium]|nr:hypothetical protein [Peptococcaceae bacterium]HPZ42593.1 hypothetical protein [Bacillota bacterium]HUM58512.1 hypothetical protein [Bacillota bacterium]
MRFPARETSPSGCCEDVRPGCEVMAGVAGAGCLISGSSAPVVAASRSGISNHPGHPGSSQGIAVSRPIDLAPAAFGQLRPPKARKGVISRSSRQQNMRFLRRAVRFNPHPALK